MSALTAKPDRRLAIVRQVVLMGDELDRMKAKHANACSAATTLEELAQAQRERINDLEEWLRDICGAKTIHEVQRIAHEALW